VTDNNDNRDDDGPKTGPERPGPTGRDGEREASDSPRTRGPRESHETAGEPRRRPPTPRPMDQLDAVPDALDPPGWYGDSPHDAIFTTPELWGGEAEVRENEYGPPIPTRFPDVESVAGEVRELERRVRARLTPVFPLEVRNNRPLRSILLRYRQFAMRDRSAVVDEMGRDPAYAARYTPLLDFLYRRYFRTQCQGIDNIPSDGRAILVANHSGALPYDALMIMRAVEREHPAGRQVRPLLEDEVFHFPYLGTFLNRMGGVRACPENAEKLLAEEQLVAVFPEGIQGIGKLYRDRYQLQRFGRGGFIKLALRTGSPIIPVAVVGAEEATPMLAKFTWLARALGLPHLPITPIFPLLGPAGLLPLPSKWLVCFGEPIDLTSEGRAADADDRLLVARMAESVRAKVQNMIGDLLSARGGSAFA
jgi:1-acyl-sn-glycerol-3-phosphate acyltransferase